MRTNNEILTDIAKLVESSPIGALSGGIYKKTRPTDSESEDCVISLISGTTGKHIKNGKLIIKIFYTDIINGDSTFEDTQRGGELERMLYDFSNTIMNGSSGYSFYPDSRTTDCQAVEDMKQHYAVSTMNFNSLN